MEVDVFVSAGEASSDIHCAELVRELKKKSNELRFYGLGGDALRAEGTELFMHIRDFSVGGGPTEILAKLPKRTSLERKVEKYLLENPKKIVGAILVDNGEINLRLSALFHFFKVPVVYYIPPKLWAWRFSRIEKIKQTVDLVLGILPFEEEIYKAWEIPFFYVGHPLVDEVDLSVSADEAKRRLGYEPQDRVFALFPGSRFNEIRYHVEPFSKSIELFFEKLKASNQIKPKVAIACASVMEEQSLFQLFESRFKESGIEFKVFKNQSHLVLKAAQVALIKSGTSTLEAAYLGTPMVLAYQTSRLSTFLFKHLVRYRGFVGMVNLFLSENLEAALGLGKKEQPVVKEMILKNCIPEKIAEELYDLYIEGDSRNKMLAVLAKTKKKIISALDVQDNPSPSALAANKTWELFSQKRPSI